MVRMISKKPHTYAGRDWNEGDEFDCEERDVHLLTVLGRGEVIAPVTEILNSAHVAPALVRAASQRAVLKRKA
jgi:hypothetical protein